VQWCWEVGPSKRSLGQGAGVIGPVLFIVGMGSLLGDMAYYKIVTSAPPLLSFSLSLFYPFSHE
jgi:hypothetical protein